MKLSACLIVRDESKTLERCLASIRPHVDELCILDTGSTDDSPAIAKRFADKWEQWTGCNGPDGRIADFSAARNRNLAMATGDAVVWLDGDDELVGGSELRKLASEAPRGPDGSFSVLAAYEYDHDAAGNVTTLQWRERLVGPPKAFEWRCPVHEGLLGVAGSAPVSSMTDKFRVVHRRRSAGKAVEPGRNLRILDAWFRAHGEVDPRLMHYFGVELMLAQRYGEAMYALRRHTILAPWSDERALSFLHMGKFHLALGDGETAAGLAFQALACKTWPDAEWLVGQSFLDMAEKGIQAEYNYQRARYWLQRGFGSLPSDGQQTKTLLMTDPTAKFEAHKALSIVLVRLSQLGPALEHGEKALVGLPDDVTLKTAVREMRAQRSRETVRRGMIELHQLGAVTREAGVLVEATLRGEFEVGRVPPARVHVGPKERGLTDRRGPDESRGLVSGSSPELAPDKLDLVLFLGHQLEPWTPRTLEANGMGGSETMAWNMARELVKLGHRVRVYAHCDDAHPEGNYDGVEWFDQDKFTRINCDVLIVSRQFGAIEAPQVEYKAAVLWVHDVHVGEHFTPAHAIRFDFIWCLSEWHKSFFLSCYPWLAPGKVEVTRNGIDTNRFRNRGIVRNPHRAIYSSSPDRGLAEAVAAWPAVRELVPDAELHVFYSFENWERTLIAMGDSPNPRCSREAKTRLVLACQTTEGVVLHGRVNQQELADEMLASGVWFYPTWFSETSCITAMECQAAGLRCVCPEIAALGETVSERIWTGNSTLDVFTAMTTDAPRQNKAFPLDQLAESWHLRLCKLVNDAKMQVVQPFFESRG